jgi:competence protein ComEC
LAPLENDPYTILEALADRKGVTVSYMKAGDRIQDGKLNITCLHPYKDFQYSSSNAYSTVLSISYGEFDMLLTGDLQQDGEKLIMDKLITLKEDNKYQITTDYDILKVAHHGSKSSTMMEFLQVIKPEYSLISCGQDNFYGHPHKELLSRLKKIKSNIMITYESGAITVKTDGKKMEIRKYKND